LDSLISANVAKSPRFFVEIVVNGVSARRDSTVVLISVSVAVAVVALRWPISRLTLIGDLD